MNDSDRRQKPDGFDHDAMFADIVAHWNDATVEPRAPRSSTKDATTHDDSSDDLSSDDLSSDQTAAPDSTATDNEAAGVQSGGGATSGATDDATAGAGSAVDAIGEATRDEPSAYELAEPSLWDGGPVNPAPMLHLPTPAPAVPSPQPIPAPQAWRAHEVDDDEDHFEPPPVAPLPVGDLQFWAIIAGMGGGPLLLLYLVLFNRDAGSSWMLTSIAMSVGGFALLIARLPRDHSDDGDDDGARL